MPKQFYFLHIDKTIAKTAGIRMFDPMYPIMEKNGIKALELNKSHKDHNYWQEFDENTFIFCVLKNPITKAISDFSWFANYGEDGLRTHNLGRDSQCPFYTKDNLFDWLDKKHIPNYQSKIISDWNINNLNKNFSRIDLVIRAEQIKGNENKIRNLIFNKLGIDYNFLHYPPDFETTFMSFENSISNLINNDIEIFKKIEKINQEDLKIYNQASDIFSINSFNTES
jgi:hypothetical protein